MHNIQPLTYLLFSKFYVKLLAYLDVYQIDRKTKYTEILSFITTLEEWTWFIKNKQTNRIMEELVYTECL